MRKNNFSFTTWGFYISYINVLPNQNKNHITPNINNPNIKVFVNSLGSSLKTLTNSFIISFILVLVVVKSVIVVVITWSVLLLWSWVVMSFLWKRCTHNSLFLKYLINRSRCPINVLFNILIK